MTKFLHTGERTINVDHIMYVETGDGLAGDKERSDTKAHMSDGSTVSIPFPLDAIVDALHGVQLFPWGVVTVNFARDKAREQG